MLSLPRVWIQSLVKELISCKLCSVVGRGVGGEEWLKIKLVKLKGRPENC